MVVHSHFVDMLQPLKFVWVGVGGWVCIIYVESQICINKRCVWLQFQALIIIVYDGVLIGVSYIVYSREEKKE